MKNKPSEYSTFGKSRSVRLDKDVYRKTGTFYFITVCCRENRTDFSNSITASIVLETWVEVIPNRKFKLWGICLMPNHLHAMVEAESDEYSLSDVIRDAKSLSLTRVRNKAPLYWQARYYDHVLRNHDDMMKHLMYLLDNPVRAGLVDEWDQWKWSYVDSDAF